MYLKGTVVQSTVIHVLMYFNVYVPETNALSDSNMYVKIYEQNRSLFTTCTITTASQIQIYTICNKISTVK